MADEVQLSGESTRHGAEHLRQYCWKPGQSANPGGKPRKPASEKLLRRLLADDELELAAVVEAWITAAKSGEMPAIKEMLERIEGKVPQPVTQSSPDGGPIEHHVTIRFVNDNRDDG